MNRIFFDTETTGLLVPSINSLEAQPYITEIHVVKLDEEFNMLDEFNSLVKPPIPIPAELESKIGITNDMIKGAPEFADIYPGLVKIFFGADEMVAHNVGYDRSMLANELLRIEKLLHFPWPPIHTDTVELSMGIEQRRINLSTLHTYATGSPHAGAHRAKEDVYALVRCYHWLQEQKNG